MFATTTARVWRPAAKRLSGEQFALQASSSVSACSFTAIATAASFALSRPMDVPYAFDPSINFLPLMLSEIIGVLFGYFPRRATQMDPI